MPFARGLEWKARATCPGFLRFIRAAGLFGRVYDLRGFDENFTRTPSPADYICRKLIHNLNLLHEAIVLFRNGHGNCRSRHCTAHRSEHRVCLDSRRLH